MASTASRRPAIGHDLIPPLDFGEMAIEQNNRNSCRSLAGTVVKATPQLAMTLHDFEITRRICVGDARNQRGAVGIQTAGDLDAAHAHPLVRLQSCGGMSARFRAHHVASPHKIEGYGYILEQYFNLVSPYIDAKQRCEKTPLMFNLN